VKWGEGQEPREYARATVRMLIAPSLLATAVLMRRVLGEDEHPAAIV
jgi:hypothetical protein